MGTFRTLCSTAPSRDSGKDKKQGMVSSIAIQKRGAHMLTASTVLFTVPSGEPMGGRKDKETGRDPGPSPASGDAQDYSVLCGDNSLTRRETTCLTPSEETFSPL